MAATHGIGRRRVDEVIELTGIASVADKRAGGFSLGMGQRLGIAAAILGDPHTLILDEPVNGLDPEGVRWVREFVRHIAAEGRTVLLSSHLMSEMAQTAAHVIVLGRGAVLADAPLPDLVRSWTTQAVFVRSPELSRLVEVMSDAGATATLVETGLASLRGVSAADIGDVAARHGIPLHELTPRSGSLEDAYLALTEDAIEYKTKELA
jgi:ABC-2 type transport system ATP-binding protein